MRIVKTTDGISAGNPVSDIDFYGNMLKIEGYKSVDL